MVNRFIANLSTEFQQAGFRIENYPGKPGGGVLLYARSASRVQLGFARVEHHFLFVDWPQSAPHEPLLALFKLFSESVNRGFPTPHALRLQIPSLVLAPVSPAGFSQEIIQFARSTYLVPWYGGETGQIILVDPEKKQLTCHRPPGRRQYGAFPLGHAAKIVQSACQRAFFND